LSSVWTVSEAPAPVSLISSTALSRTSAHELAIDLEEKLGGRGLSEIGDEIKSERVKREAAECEVGGPRHF